MARLKQWPYYRNYGLAVAMWEGDTGDVLPVMLDRSTKRSEVTFYSIVLRGRFQMFDPSMRPRWLLTPGMTSDDGGDFIGVGVFRWTAMQDKSQEICFSSIDANGHEDEGVVRREVRDLKDGERFRSNARVVLVLATGKVKVGNEVFEAPYVLPTSRQLQLVAQENGTRVIEVGK